MKATHQFSVSPEQFYTPSTPQISYLLGLIWADGYVKTLHRKSLSDAHRIEVSMMSEDMNELIDIFYSTGKWCVSNRQRINKKPQTSVITNNKPLVNFLETNNYGVKSNSSANKILSKIPDELKKYWFRGLSDGDGCFYVNEKNRQCQFSITSTLNQNWDYAENLLIQLKIKYSIQRLVRNCGEHSSIRITSKEGVSKFGDFIYSDYDKDKLGLSRKYIKYRRIKHLYQTFRQSPTPSNEFYRELNQEICGDVL
jgi:hypothetical protein